MIEEPKSAFEQVTNDPNFLMILIGAIIWYVGFYTPFIGGLLISTGFVLVCFAAALNAVRRAVDIAWRGLLLGGLIQVIGYYLGWVPFLGTLLIVVGGVLIMYFAIPLAIQKGELPILTQIQKVIDDRKKSEKKKDEKEETSPEADEETDDTEETEIGSEADEETDDTEEAES